MNEDDFMLEDCTSREFRGRPPSTTNWPHRSPNLELPWTIPEGEHFSAMLLVGRR
jgi:hypothetical protein